VGQEGAEGIAEFAEVVVGHPAREGKRVVGERGRVLEDSFDLPHLDAIRLGVLLQDDPDEGARAEGDEDLRARMDGLPEVVGNVVGEELIQGSAGIGEDTDVGGSGIGNRESRSGIP
jgi:hypothetical protein